MPLGKPVKEPVGNGAPEGKPPDGAPVGMPPENDGGTPDGSWRPSSSMPVGIAPEGAAPLGLPRRPDGLAVPLGKPEWSPPKPPNPPVGRATPDGKAPDGKSPEGNAPPEGKFVGIPEGRPLGGGPEKD